MGDVGSTAWEDLHPSTKARLKARASQDRNFVAGLSAELIEDIKRDRSHFLRKDVVKEYIRKSRTSEKWKDIVKMDC